MPVNAARRSALRKLAGKLNTVAAKYGVAQCDRDAGLGELKKLRRRLILRLHTDKSKNAGTNADFQSVQAAWEEWLKADKETAEDPRGPDAGERRTALYS